MTLYREDGTKASLDDVIEWFNWIYPSDVFVTHPIAIVRGLLNAIQKKVLTTNSLQKEKEQ